MELMIAAGALIVGAAGLIVAFRLRAELGQADERMAKATRDTQHAVATLRDELHRVRGEVADLRATVERPPPPLPRARGASLDDLRERIRAEEEIDEPDERSRG